MVRIYPPFRGKGGKTEKKHGGWGIKRNHISGKYWEIASPASRDRNDRQFYHVLFNSLHGFQ